MYYRASQFQVPTARSRFTNKQTKQDKTRQDRSRLDQVLQVPVTVPVTVPVPVPVPVTCIYHSPVSPSYAMQNSRRFWQSMTWSVSPTSSSSYLRPASMYLVTLCTIPVPDYQASKQASKQSVSCCHRSASTGLVSMYCMYVQDMCVCVCELLYPSQHSQQTPYSTGRPPPYRMFCLLVARQTRLKCM